MFIHKYSPEYSAILYAFFSAIALSLIFLIFRYFGWAGNIWLRVVDVLVLYVFASRVIEYYRAHHKHISYFQCLAISMMTCVLSMVFFSLFLFVYTMFISPEFMVYLKETAPMGEHLNPYIITATLVIEGVAIGFVVSLIKVNTLEQIQD
jgi:hypothetical protein